MTPDADARVHSTATHLTHVATAGDPSGVPVLFLHGTGPGATGAQSFRPLLADLSGYRCLLPDLVGFGNSSHPDPPPVGPRPWLLLRAACAIELLDELALPRVHLVAHSYGARVALELLRRVPERVGSAVLIAAGGTPVTARLGSLTSFYRDPSESAMESFVTSQMARPPAVRLNDYVAHRFAVASRPDVRRSFEAAMAAGEPAPTYDADALAAIPNAVLAVHGKDDPTIPFGASLHLSEHLPKCDLHLFTHCGHLPQFEVPTALCTLITEFLSRGSCERSRKEDGGPDRRTTAREP